VKISVTYWYSPSYQVDRSRCALSPGRRITWSLTGRPRALCCLISAGSTGPEGLVYSMATQIIWTEVLDASDWTASELTQVDASGCESGDNGGKGNQTAPASGRLQCRRNQQFTGGGCCSCGRCSERFRDKLMAFGAALATRYLKCVKPGERRNRPTLVHHASSSATAATNISAVLVL